MLLTIDDSSRNHGFRALVRGLRVDDIRTRENRIDNSLFRNLSNPEMKTIDIIFKTICVFMNKSSKRHCGRHTKFKFAIN